MPNDKPQQKTKRIYLSLAGPLKSTGYDGRRCENFHFDEIVV